MSRNTSSTLQLALSIFALLGVSTCGLITLATGFFQQNARIPGISNDLSMFLWASSAGLTGALLLPSIWYSYKTLQGKVEPVTKHRQPLIQSLLPSILMLTIFPLVIATGSMLQQSPLSTWLMPWLHLISSGLPVYWLLHTAIHRLPASSPQRYWGVFTSGLLIGPQMIIVIELLVIFTAIIAFSIYIAGRPDLAAQIESLAQRLPFAIDSQARLSKMLEPYLRSPILIVSVLGFIAVIVPVIEETLKPIGVWLLVGRNLTAAEGFVAGAISGAGYALFENLFIPNSGVGWAAVALGRMGTAAMHILASALTGWGLALAWREGKYLRLGLQYLAAIALHSTWNATTVINAGVNLLPQTPTLIVTAQALTYAMGILALSIFILIIFFSRRLAVVAPPPDSDLQATNSLS